MSLPAPYSEVYLEGDGVTTEFAFGTNFKPISAGLVKCIVYLEDGYEVVPTYTVNMAVGSITISALTMPDTTVLTAPPLGSMVRIFRDEPEAQPVSASQIQSYTSKQLEILFDAIVAMIQEVSYTVDHKTVRLTEPQRDISLQKLTDLVDGHLIYWDAIKRELVVTNYPQQDVVQCVSGLFFKIETDPNTHNPYLEWSTDNSDWHAINVDAAQALAQDAYTLADSAYNLASTTRGELNAHKADHNNPHETSMTKLIDTNFNGLTSGQFLQFNGINWVNVDYNTTVTWGGIVGNIDDQTDLKNALDSKVDVAGDTMTGALNIAYIASSNAPLLTLTHSSTATYKWNIAPRYNSTTLSIYPGNTETNGFRFATTGFVPASNNARYLGSASLKWKGIYVGVINNGADLTVPNKTGTLATMGDVELAARSGRMLTDQGVWYAKMYAATVVPTGAEYDGKNYADFSQVDADNNPIIKIYTGASGAWTLSETITPPADYDGYVPVTSKIWDIAEQSGQQGGRVLWNHTSKEFTPYPTIISFEDAALTGTPTAPTPDSVSPNNQIATKEYVDNHVPADISTYHPDLFDWKWADHQVNDVQWLRADTFSWQSGSVYPAAYKHLRNDMYNWYSWANNGTTIYTKKAYPEVGEKVYSNSALTTEVGEITDVTDTLDITVEKITVNGVVYDSVSGSNIAPTTETVGGVTVQYIPAEDGHKIVTDFHESEVADAYTATGVAWYYIIDYGSKRFKLPRLSSDKEKVIEQVNSVPVKTSSTSNTVSNWAALKIGRATDGGNNAGDGGTLIVYSNANMGVNGQNQGSTDMGASVPVNLIADFSDINSFFGGKKHLYFYVGEFTQTALENTAGITAETLNDKVDVGHEVIAFQAPTAQNNYTWYRKYADGWVEQGGKDTASTYGITAKQVVLPVEMADNNYSIMVTKIANTTGDLDGAGVAPQVAAMTTTGFYWSVTYTSALGRNINWRVEGMAA